MKTRLKILLICLGILLVSGGTWAGLTKAGIIPNWIGISLWDIDCKGQTFEYNSDIGIPTINGRKCKEGTYKKIIFTQRPGCPACQ